MSLKPKEIVRLIIQAWITPVFCWIMKSDVIELEMSLNVWWPRRWNILENRHTPLELSRKQAHATN